MKVVHLNRTTNEAQSFKQKLGDMLALENQSSWIEIMDYAHQKVPFLGEAGTPSKVEIQNSLIGELGYPSWKAFIEDALGWSDYKWKKWRTAYKRVLEYPYLRHAVVNRSAILTAHKILKDSFPPDLDAWKTYKINLHKKSKNESVTAPVRNDSSVDLINRLEAKNNLLEMELLNVNNKNAIYAKQLLEIQDKTSQYAKELRNEQNRTQNLKEEVDLIAYESNMNLRNMFILATSVILPMLVYIHYLTNY